MSWTDELERVYELCIDRAGEFEAQGEAPLLPAAHSTANAQITVCINLDGTKPPSGFAQTVPKEPRSETVTVIPVTEASAARSSGVAPHPLNDKLIYVAGDFSQYAAGKRVDNSKYYSAYMEQLKAWCDSPYTNEKIRAIYAYLSNAALIADLVEAKALVTDPETGRLTDDKINGIAQQDCFVRFKVNGEPTWTDKELQESFIRFNSMGQGEPQLCYATGEQAVPTYKHPNKIRNAGDKGKLFSTNDESGFSYRGRFCTKEEAVSIGYDYSQKIHSALKWLIARQGTNIGDLCILTWESALKQLPSIVEADMFGDTEDEKYDPQKVEKNLTVHSLFGHEVAQRYGADSKTMLLMLDSATTGRVSMSMYAELQTSEYLANLKKWHGDTAWNKFGKTASFSMREIASYAFGTEKGRFVECSPDIMKQTVQRLVPCAAQGRNIPQDIVRGLVARACRPTAYDPNTSHWEAVLYCACGMLRRQTIERKGECTMALDTERRTRDYIYGRLLAVADRAESSTYARDEARTTNARRFFEAFSNHPCTTWAVINKNLRPYLDRMNEGSRITYEKLINELTDMMSVEQFSDNSPLAPEFLHAYSCQLNALYTKKTDENKEEN